MAKLVEIGLADGTKLIVENATEDEVMQSIAQMSGPIGAATVVAREGTYRVLPEHVVYVRSVSESP